MGLFSVIGDVVEGAWDTAVDVVEGVEATVKGAAQGDITSIVALAAMVYGGWAMMSTTGAGAAAAGSTSTTVGTTTSTTVGTTTGATAATTGGSVAAAEAGGQAIAQAGVQAGTQAGAQTALAETAKELTMKDVLLAGAKQVGQSVATGMVTEALFAPEAPKTPERQVSVTESFDTTPRFSIGTSTSEANVGGISKTGSVASNINVLGRIREENKKKGLIA